MNWTRLLVTPSLFLLTLISLPLRSQTPHVPEIPGDALSLSQRVSLLVAANDAEALRKLGPDTIPALVFLYDTGDEPRRIRVANLFHALSWTSPEAERSLLGDLHTANVELRLAVEFALGRVSADPRVVEALLDTLQNDPTPLFRDKAACALAYDQVHLAEPQKVRLYEGLIQALSNPEPQVQAVSIQALSILTGETKGFHPLLPPERKQRSIDMWERWLAERRGAL